MKTERPLQPLSPTQFAALVDDAKSRALRARREAMREFPADLGRAARSVWRSLALDPHRPQGRP